MLKFTIRQIDNKMNVVYTWKRHDGRPESNNWSEQEMINTWTGQSPVVSHVLPNVILTDQFLTFLFTRISAPPISDLLSSAPSPHSSLKYILYC
jgi:hypothetical protein